MPTLKDSDHSDDARRGGPGTVGDRSDEASFAALFTRHRRLSGLRLLKPNRRAVIPAVSCVLFASLVVGVATLISHIPSGNSDTVAASRPGPTSTNAAPAGESSAPTARGHSASTHAAPAPHRKSSGTASALPPGQSAGHPPAPGLPALPPESNGGGGGTGSGAATSTSTVGHSSGATQDGGSVNSAPPPVGTTTSSPTSSGPLEITGQLLCESGHAVVGVWVQTDSAATSQYAAWKGIGDGSTADWWASLPKDMPYHLAVGCGGTPSSWGTSNRTQTFSGGHNSFNCDDISGSAGYETCTHR
jgi:hypothetical protein